MTKQELSKLIKQAVKESINEELKSMRILMKKTIKEEFYRILNEAEQAKSLNENNYSLTSALEPENDDEIRNQIERKIFQGNDPIAAILNKTANDGVDLSNYGAGGGGGPAGIYSNSVPKSVPINPAPISSPPENMSLAKQIASGRDKRTIAAQENAGLTPTEIAMKNMNRNYKDILQLAEQKARNKRNAAPTRAVGGKSNLNQFKQRKEDSFETQYLEEKE